MAFLDRYPVLKKAVANQYQAILVAGATAFSALTLSPLPLLLLAGLELMAAPFLLERIKRRLEIEKKYAERQFQAMSQEQRFEALTPASRERFIRMRRLCERIGANYRGLSPASQGMLADQEAKFDAILASFLRHLWLVQKYDEMTAAYDEEESREELQRIRQQLGTPDLDPRLREALEKNQEIREHLEKSVRQNAANRQALLAELDSLEAVLQLLLQKSIAATDATAFSLEIDDVLARVEADAASVEEMERLFGTLPEATGAQTLSPRIKQASLAPPPPPPPPPPVRGREGRRR